MRGVGCEGGLTQIGKVLSHALDESRRRKVNALVYVGDSMEEDVDRLCARAGELGAARRAGVRVPGRARRDGGARAFARSRG